MKQTEIGLIPDDWEVKELGSIVKIIMGQSPDSQYYNINCKGFVLIQGNADIENRKTITRFYTSQITKIAKKDEIILTVRAPVGSVAKATSNCCLGRGVCALKTTSEFLYQFLILIEKSWEKTSTGSTFDSINSSNLSKTLVILPKDEKEQQKIAKALSDVDNAIFTLEKLVAKKSNIKQGTMQCLLIGKKRLPGFAKSINFKRTEIGEIPEDWEVKTIDSVFDLFAGGDVDKNHFSAEKVGNYKFDIYSNGLDNYGIYGYTNFPKYKGNSITITGRGTVGVAMYRKNNFDAVIRLLVLTPKSTMNVSSEFLSHFINTYIDFPNESTGVPQLTIPQIKHIPIAFPLYNEQIAIAKVLSDMDKEIDELNAKVKKYRNLKIGMMQQLLTGKIRLIDSNAPVVKSKKNRSAPLAFKRSVLAAEIANRLCDEPTFGHVKMEKLLFLAEKMCNVDIGSSYHRDAAGPYDNRGIRSIDSQLEKQRWFKAVKKDKKYCYIPLENRGGHVEYFERYCAGKKEIFDYIIKIFRRAKTEQCEIIATLYSAWEDFLKQGITPTDEQIVNEVLTNWHEAKKRISEDRWLSALGWMKEKGFVP